MSIHKTTFALLTTTALAGKCPFGYGGGSKIEALAQTETVADITYPQDYFKCSTTAPLTTINFTANDYEDIARSVIQQYEALDPTASDNYNPRGNYAGCLVRLVGHDFMDFRRGTINTGGSDGCLNFQDPDNLGLKECIQNFKFADVYQQHCSKVSLADFFVIAAEAIMGRTTADYNASDPFNP